MRRGQFTDRPAAVLQRLQHLAAGRVCQCGKHGIQDIFVFKLNHLA